MKQLTALACRLMIQVVDSRKRWLLTVRVTCC